MHRNVRMFFDAYNGIKIAWDEEKNFRIHVGAMVLVLLASWYFKLSREEFLAVVFAMGLVITAELFNTALEELCDKFQPEHDPHIGKIKDLSAGAVFAATTASVVIGVIIFLPRVLSLLS